jgi:sulfur carrier protein
MRSEREGATRHEVVSSASASEPAPAAKLLVVKYIVVLNAPANLLVPRVNWWVKGLESARTRLQIYRQVGVAIVQVETAPSGVRQVTVNGRRVETEAITLADLVQMLGYESAKVATAVNGDFVAQRQRAAVMLAELDRVEIVAAREGG